MRYIVATFALCLLVISAQAGTFVDDFEDGNLDGWIQGYPHGAMKWKVIDGAAEVSDRTHIGTWIATGEYTWTDYTIEYDVKLLQDHGPGEVDIIARVTPNSGDNSISDFYFAGIGDYTGTSGVYAYIIQGWSNAPITGLNPFDSLELDRWHHLKLEAKGDNFTFWINGIKALEFQNDTLPQGKAGLYVVNYTARFDNVVISGPDVPDNTAAVSLSGKMATRWGRLRSQ